MMSLADWEPLALDHPLALVGAPGGRRVRLEDRGPGLLDLQEERTAVAAEKEGEAARCPTPPTPTTLRAMCTWR